MSDDDIPSDDQSPPKDAGPIGLRVINSPVQKSGPDVLTLRRITPEATTQAPATVTRLRFDTPQRPERVPRLFETLRIVDLARFRQSLRRHKVVLEKKGGEFDVAAPARAKLLVQLEALYQGPMTRWPDVVVIRRPETGAIETNFAILGEAIYLGAHLSSDWEEGRESDRFYDTLREALLEQVKARKSQFEPVRGQSGKQPSTQE